jgi:hypothetical protein
MQVAKSDCLSIDKAVQEIGVSKTAFYKYIKHLGIASHKFPFDRKGYVLKSDVERIRQFTEEIRE